MTGIAPRELTLRGVVLGAILTVVFTAANVYLGLRVGLTFATAIPAAVSTNRRETPARPSPVDAAPASSWCIRIRRTAMPTSPASSEGMT